jgi:hypothetical protein
MMIQEWFYLFLAMYGFISLIFTICYISLWITEKRLEDKSDFVTRLQRGEILDKNNIF